MSEPKWTEILGLLSEVINKHGEQNGAKVIECFRKIYRILEVEDETVRGSGTGNVFQGGSSRS